MQVSKPEIICKLEEMINNGKRVLVFDCDDEMLLRLSCEYLEDRDISKCEIWYCMKGVENCSARLITRKQMDDVLKIYRMYDFSDKVSVISNSIQYGSMFNYVKNGILSKKEMVEALLYKF